MEATADTAFVEEMYPQLLHYYHWWYLDRDHDSNGICEFGSVDGTIEAAVFGRVVWTMPLDLIVQKWSRIAIQPGVLIRNRLI